MIQRKLDLVLKLWNSKQRGHTVAMQNAPSGVYSQRGSDFSQGNFPTYTDLVNSLVYTWTR